MSLFAHAAGLQLGYERHVAVASSDLEIPAGKLTAIIGPNGSGKSTLLHALAGLVAPQRGSLEVLGGDPAHKRAEIAYVMQSVAFPEGVPLSVREIVAMGRYPSRGWFRPLRGGDKQHIAAVMRRLRVSDLSDRHLEELSGGQRQRVYVAQGLAQEHSALLLDEPLTGLDLISARTIDEIIHDETEHGCTVVHTTHDVDEARAADHVILMSGKVVAFGKPAQVLTETNLRLAYNLGELHESAGFIAPHPNCEGTA